MKIEYVIIAGVLLLFFLLFVIFIVTSRKKVNKAEKKILFVLDNIEDRLNDKEKIIIKTKDLIKDENYLKNFQDEDFERDSIHELYELLDDFMNKFDTLILDDEKLLSNKKVVKIRDLIVDNEIKLRGAVNYYNDMIDNYLKLKNTFPISIVKVFSGFKKYKKIDIKKD